MSFKATSISDDLNIMSTKEKIVEPNWIKVIATLIIITLIVSFLLLTITPWQQTSQGNGRVIALDPNNRVQGINSTVPGRVNKWLVQDGAFVKKGDPIVEIIDNDPNLLDRLKLERDAVLRKYEAAKAASETASLNMNRQELLLKKGLSSQKEYEKTRISYKKLLAAEATAAANLAGAEVKLSRQQNQLITASRDGTILRILHGSGSVFVKEGELLATFVPSNASSAVELYINGNDLPLVYPGRHVRLQFEGWPAVQFGGWPSVSIGTFGGIVNSVDNSASSNGKFRVIIVPGENDKWPSSKYLRQGARVYGWILLNEVRLGYEVWRQFNGFPAALDNPPDDLVKLKESYEKSKKIENKKHKELYKDE